MPLAAIVSKPNKPELKEVLSGVLDWLRTNGYDVVVDEVSASYVSGLKTRARDQLASEKPAFVIVLGGDGTLLSAARAVAHAGIPLLAVNLGSLGFLTEVSLPELYENLRSIVANCCNIDERSMLHCRLLRGAAVLTDGEALNDVVLKGTAPRLVEFDVTINGHHVATYMADALIVSTPTGSTAYSLAAGGPILAPNVKAFVITPVSPHALTHRPLVVEESARIAIRVSLGNEEATLALDGQVNLPLKDGDLVECDLAEDRVKLMRVSDGYKFFDILRAKLHWGER
jgi:NAD+ kinase